MHIDELELEVAIIAKKIHGKENPSLGFIKPVFREIDGEYIPLTIENFCPSGQVFIISGYEEIDSKYAVNEFFRIIVTNNKNPSETSGFNPSTYVASGRKTERLRPRDLVEIVNAELPDNNNLILHEDIKNPSTKYIFLKNKIGAVFGPLEWESGVNCDGQIHVSIPTTLLPGPKLLSGQIYQLPENKLKIPKVLVTDDGRLFLKDLQEVLTNSTFYDYASDHDIINFCGKFASTFKTSPITKQQLRTLDAQAKGPTAQPFAKARWDRFSKITAEVISTQTEAVHYMIDFLNGEAGKKIVQDFIKNNESKFLSSIISTKKNEISAGILIIEDERRMAAERLREINQQKKDASAELERLKVDQEAQKTIVPMKQANSDADANLSKKYVELDRLKEDIEEKSKILNGMVSLIEMDAQKKRINVELDVLRDQNTSIKNSTKELRKEYKDEEDEIRNKLIKIKPLIDTINGSFTTGSIEFPNITISPAFNDREQRGLSFQKDVVATIERSLTEKGRNVQSWEVVNLLINTQQSFITFLSGLPGAGKTSICRMLASTQGLDQRFIEISVARGWTNLKDMVGFYNPLSSRFQPSNTGLFQFLSSLHMEAEQKVDTSMAYILLDEANLSPIEHYWSSFMAMTDGLGQKKLSLGQDSLIIPNNLRFLATINYDGTTEPLSPRIVDRSPIIMMETLRTNEYFDFASENIASLPLSTVVMEDLFGNNLKVPAFENNEEKTFLTVCSALSDPNPEKGRPINVSTRKEHAIRQYCGKARPIMREDSDLAALDLAILQHVLPLIRGSGGKFAKRLDELKKIFKERELPRSEAYLDRMIAYGASELHSYDFFCW